MSVWFVAEWYFPVNLCAFSTLLLSTLWLNCWEGHYPWQMVIRDNAKCKKQDVQLLYCKAETTVLKNEASDLYKLSALRKQNFIISKSLTWSIMIKALNESSRKACAIHVVPALERNHSWVRWIIPVIPVLWEAEVGGSLEPISLRPA